MTNIQIAVRETVKILSHPEGREVEALSKLEWILSISRKENDEFCQKHYSRFLERLLSFITVDWIGIFPKDQVNTHISNLILTGPPATTFLVLVNSIENIKRAGFQLSYQVSLLEKFLQSERLFIIFLSSLDPCCPTDIKQLWEQLLTMLVSLPERMANILKQENSEIFLPQQYIPLLARQIMKTLQKAYDYINAEKDCSLEFLSHLFGKICGFGYSDVLWDTVLPIFSSNASSNFIWSRIYERMVTKVPDAFVESTIVPLVHKAAWHGTLSKILGDSVVNNPKIEFLLTKKLLLHRYFQKPKILQNIFGYLSLSSRRRGLIPKVLLVLIDVWGDKSTLKHTPYEQHFFITMGILVAACFIDEEAKKEISVDVINKLMKGMQLHLGSSVNEVRILGMVIGEELTKAFDPNGPQKLNFEIEDGEEVRMLRSLLQPPPEPAADESINTITETLLSNLEIRDEEPTSSKVYNDDSSELDSDDDLEPYDQSADTPVALAKKPYYLRQCMEGLISSDDPDKFEACLETAEKLIRQAATNIHEIAAEFCKILIHLQDSYSTTNFYLIRHKAMVALAVMSPKSVAEYLTCQFYGKNYNLQQRMEMLQVLADAAQELSSPSSTHTKVDGGPKIKVLAEGEKSENWRDIVEKRIESKTRRFGKGPRKKVPETKNRFADVAGDFFFPLMRYFDRPEKTCDLLGEDSMVLSRLIYTLGVIIFAAVNTPVVLKMAPQLLAFLWVMRFHPDSAVRKAVLFSMAMLILATPAFFLLTDLQGEMSEAKAWLEDVAEHEVDSDNQKLAFQNLVLFEKTVKEEIVSHQSDMVS